MKFRTWPTLAAVADETVPVSNAQVMEFVQVIGDYVQPVQALNNRLVAGPFANN